MIQSANFMPNVLPGAPAVAQPGGGEAKIVFVGNLPYSTDEDTLTAYFSNVGQVVAVRIAEDGSGKRKGFAHVEFASHAEAVNALQYNGEYIEGRQIRLDLTYPRSTEGGGDGKTCFVKGFDRSQPEEAVRAALTDAFGAFGEVERVRLPVDRAHGSLKGFGYVTFTEVTGAPEKAAAALGQTECAGGVLFIDPFAEAAHSRGAVPEEPAAARNDIGKAKVVFVGNLPYSTEEAALTAFFSAAGQVEAVRIAEDMAGRRKGFAHVEFTTHAAALKATRFSGRFLEGRPIRVDLTYPRATDRPVAGAGGALGGAGGGGDGRTCFVKGFDRNLAEEEVREALTEAFGAFGAVERVRLPVDRDTRGLKGFAYVVFAEADGALEKAAAALGQTECAGGVLFIDPHAQPFSGRRM